MSRDIPIDLIDRDPDQPRTSWVALLAVLILVALPLLGASAFSSRQTIHTEGWSPVWSPPTN